MDNIRQETYDVLAGFKNNGEFPVLYTQEMPIIDGGGHDYVTFEPFSKTLPVAVIGKKASDSIFQTVANATGYQLNPANDYDQIILSNQGFNAADGARSFKVMNHLTGVGTTIQFQTGFYTKVICFYIKGFNPNSYDMVRFTTQEGVNDYTDAGLRGLVPAYIIYGQQILDETEYSINGSTITLSVGNVEAGKKLVVIPVA